MKANWCQLQRRQSGVVPATHPLNCRPLARQCARLSVRPPVVIVPLSQSRKFATRCAAAAAEGLSYKVPTAQSITLVVPGTPDIVLQTGEIGRQANGAVMATMGDTVIYSTACCSGSPVGDGSFLPLTVNYQVSSATLPRPRLPPQCGRMSSLRLAALTPAQSRLAQRRPLSRPPPAALPRCAATAPCHPCMPPYAHSPLLR